MLGRTRDLWDKQTHLVGDRTQLFSAVADAFDTSSVLYPGSYVDLTPSFVWPSVTYVDVDRRAKQFFADVDGIRDLLDEHTADTSGHSVRFIHADYQGPLDLSDASFDLLISLYSGFVSEHCTRYLRVGGHLLANPSHGDVAMASIDPRYRLRAVVDDSDDQYVVTSVALDTYLIAKRVSDVTAEHLHQTGRGIDYTKTAFAYLFERIDETADTPHAVYPAIEPVRGRHTVAQATFS